MNAKKAKAIRRAMLGKVSGRDNRDYGIEGHPWHDDKKRLHYSLTYHVVGVNRLVKMGKLIYNKYGVMPNA